MSFFHAQQKYAHMYRGIFVNPLDYDIAESIHGLARLKKMAGLPITEREEKDFKRINQLERLGGIQEPLGPMTAEDMKELLAIGESLRLKQQIPSQN